MWLWLWLWCDVVEGMKLGMGMVVEIGIGIGNGNGRMKVIFGELEQKMKISEGCLWRKWMDGWVAEDGITL